VHDPAQGSAAFDPVGEHVLELTVRQDSVLTFLASRFAGVPATSNC